jgi:phytoene desaturase
MKPRVAVIGSGFGGLASAIRLQAQGFPVTIFEKRDKAGGRAYVYRQDGFTFDAGPTVITAPDCLKDLFELSGKRMEDYLELIKLSPMYRLRWEDGLSFDYSDDIEDTIAQIAKINPEDARNYPAFLEYTRQVFVEGYEKLAHVPFLDFTSMIKVSPQLMKLQAFRTVYGMVGKYLKDPHLRQAFSFHSLLVGGNPFTASSIYTLIHYLEKKWGVYFAKGGTNAAVSALVKLFTDIGGEIRFEAEVDRIVTRDGKVTGLVVGGREEDFGVVVSNGDVVHTYQKLLRQEPAVERTRKGLLRARQSMSLFVLYFGTKKRYPGLAHHNILFGNRYKALLDDIFNKGVLADDFSLYLHVPTVTDPSVAPEGCENFYALSPVPHLGKAALDWKIEGPKYADKILSYLEKHYLPGLKQEIITQRHFTPDDFKYELNAHLGSAFSLEPVLWQSAYFRVHNRDAHLKGLYFAGAGTHPGAGIPGVIGSAQATAGLVVEDYHLGNVETLDRVVQDQRFGAAPQPLAAAAREETSPEVAVALAQCRSMIRVGSKSFSMASHLFGEKTRDAAHFLYGWCRYSDDQVDSVRDPVEQLARVEELRRKTADAFRGAPAPEPVFVALSHIATEFRIPSYYAEELLEGMAMDVRRQSYATAADLGLYCYRVAGTVGLMMSHVMGVSDERALEYAGALGSAMQMTNIARDVMEDAAMGRVYLPEAWLREEGLAPSDVGLANNREAVARVVRRLLELADRYYAIGNSGLKFLPWRAALAVGTASSVYSDIGRVVRSRGARAWDERAVVSKGRKLSMVLKGLLLTLKTVPYRIAKPWRPVELNTIWRHT